MTKLSMSTAELLAQPLSFLLLPPRIYSCLTRPHDPACAPITCVGDLTAKTKGGLWKYVGRAGRTINKIRGKHSAKKRQILT